MTDEVHFTSSCLYYGGVGSLGENREPSRPNEVVYNIDQGGAEPHHPDLNEEQVSRQRAAAAAAAPAAATAAAACALRCGGSEHLALAPHRALALAWPALAHAHALAIASRSSISTSLLLAPCPAKLPPRQSS